MHILTIVEHNHTLHSRSIPLLHRHNPTALDTLAVETSAAAFQHKKLIPIFRGVYTIGRKVVTYQNGAKDRSIPYLSLFSFT